jgi:hypothetical protein
MVTAILTLVLIPIGMVWEFSGMAEKQRQDQIKDVENNPNMQPQQKKEVIDMQKKIQEVVQPLTYASWGFSGLCNLLALVGAIKMKNLSSSGWAYTSAILSVIPCTNGICCILGLPFGIWALIVLSNPDVKRAFVKGGSAPRDDDYDRRRDDDRDDRDRDR